jgi:hypothetical protein
MRPKSSTEETVPNLALNSLCSKGEETIKPEWILLIEGTLANRLVLASLLGLFVATAAVCYMAVTSLRGPQRANPAAVEIPAPHTIRAPLVVPTQESAQQKNVGDQPDAKSPSDVTSNQTSSTDELGKVSRRHRRSGGQHVRRHAYSSYGR